MIEIQIINMLSLFWKHTTFLLFIALYLFRGIFQNKQKQKTAKQTSKTKQNKKEKKKKKRKRGKSRSLAEYEPGSFGLPLRH